MGGGPLGILYVHEILTHVIWLVTFIIAQDFWGMHQYLCSLLRCNEVHVEEDRGGGDVEDLRVFRQYLQHSLSHQTNLQNINSIKCKKKSIWIFQETDPYQNKTDPQHSLNEIQNFISLLTEEFDTICLVEFLLNSFQLISGQFVVLFLQYPIQQEVMSEGFQLYSNDMLFKEHMGGLIFKTYSINCFFYRKLRLSDDLFDLYYSF